MSGTARLDWPSFEANDRVQPLRIVTTNTRTMSATVLGRNEGSYHDLPTLLSCLRASMLVPGIAGELVGVSAASKAPFKIRDHLKSFSYDDDNDDDDESDGSSVDVGTRHDYSSKNGTSIGDIHDSNESHSTRLDRDGRNDNIVPEDEKRTMGTTTTTTTTTTTIRATTTTTTTTTAAAIVRSAPHHKHYSIPNSITPLVDSFLVEPMPYRSAAREGATHMIVLRTKPDPIVIKADPQPHHHRHYHRHHHRHSKATTGGIYENVIASRFFMSHQLPLPRDWLLELKHQQIYQSDRKLTYHWRITVILDTV